MSNADNVGNNQQMAYYNVPAIDYLPLWGKKPPNATIIPITFTKYLIFVCVGGTFIATSILWLTNWWQTLLLIIANTLYIQFWYIGWPATFVFIGVAYYMFKRRSKRIKAEKTRLARMQKLDDARIYEYDHRGGD